MIDSAAVSVRLPDGTVTSHPAGTTALDVAEGIGSRLASAVVAAEVNGTVVDAMRPLDDLPANDSATSEEPLDLVLLTSRNMEGPRKADLDQKALDVMRHSCAHVMARAVMRLFDGVGLAFGPTIDNGFYYDFDLATPIREEDFPKIEAEMKKIIKEAEPFERFSLPRGEAVEFFNELAQELKVEHIKTGLADEGDLSCYRQGEFVDLCRGPHIPNPSRIKAIKVLSVAGSHWKGDQSNRALQRIYGTAFFDKKDLKAYLTQLEEAKRRDHRVLGKKLGLFHIDPKVGQGLCLWLPKGAMIRGVLEEFLKAELVRRGYEPVYSPHIGRVELYLTSGHFPYYRESQFAPLFSHAAGQLVDHWRTLLSENELSSDVEADLKKGAEALGASFPDYNSDASTEEKIGILEEWESRQERYLLKPMNCPHHAMMYKSSPRSYRQLPIRFAEFGTVYRHEQSGELNGMLRVRGLTQDDAHIFCTPDQVEEEFRSTIALVRYVLEAVGLNDYRVQLSLRDPNSDKYVGSEENWQRAEASLRGVLEEAGLNYSAEEGEAAFYGPKVDFMVKDAIGREWQLGTVQLDYNLPERFELEYIGTDNKPHRPVMIHRAPFGSVERFVGMLIEHFAGAVPLWLAPEQVRVLPLSEKSYDYAQQVETAFKEAGFRATTDLQGAKLQAKIREAQHDLIPYMLIVGPKEAEQNAVALRHRTQGDLGAMPIADALDRLRGEVERREIPAAAEEGSESE